MCPLSLSSRPATPFELMPTRAKTKILDLLSEMIFTRVGGAHKQKQEINFPDVFARKHKFTCSFRS
jgi:transcriptional regulator with AAA-type ATPase domain